MNSRIGIAIGAAAAGALLVSGCSSGTPAPGDATLWFAFGLDRQQDDLASAAFAANTTGDQFRQYKTLAEVGTQYGASTDNINSALATLSDAGFTGAVDPTHGVITGTFTADKAESFFGVNFNESTNSSGVTTVSPARDLKVPGSLRDQVNQVFGGRATLTDANTDTEQPSASAEPEGAACPVSTGAESVRKKLSEMYGFADLGRRGALGQNVTIGLLSIGHYSPEAIKLFEKCFDHEMPPVTQVMVNATPETLNPSNTETSLDIVSAGLIAPNLKGLDLFSFDGNSSLVFPLAKVLENQNTDKPIDILSSSIAFCSSTMTTDELEMTEWLLAGAALSGITVVASAGDTGSSGCYPPNKGADTQYPAESPFVTAMGGTEIKEMTGGKLEQQVWNESPNQELAGGGGPSVNLPKPDYQANLDSAEKNRMVPDLAFLADPSEVGPIAVCNRDAACTFDTVAGTSATAPAFAGALSMVIDSLRGVDRLGLINPVVYQIAETPNESVVLDVTQGNNDLFGVGCCTAEKGYDQASGWGSLNVSEFVKEYNKLLPTG